MEEQLIVWKSRWIGPYFLPMRSRGQHVNLAGNSDSTSVKLGHYSIWEADMRQIFQQIFLSVLLSDVRAEVGICRNFAQKPPQGRCSENGHDCQDLPHKPGIPQTLPLVKASEQFHNKICLAVQFFKIL